MKRIKSGHYQDLMNLIVKRGGYWYHHRRWDKDSFKYENYCGMFTTLKDALKSAEILYKL